MVKKYLLQGYALAIVLLLFVAVQSYAFTEPTQSPPDGNVPAPINVGDSTQEKTGSLTVNTANRTLGLLVAGGRLQVGVENSVNVGGDIGLFLNGGKLRIMDGNEQNGRVLITDNNGRATWRDIAEGNLGNGGHQRFPNGLLIQWGRGPMYEDNSTVVDFPVPFTNINSYNITATGVGERSQSEDAVIGARRISEQQVEFFTDRRRGIDVNWIAIGF